MLRIDAIVYRVFNDKVTIYINSVEKVNADGDIGERILIINSTNRNAITFYVMDSHVVIPDRYYYIPSAYDSKGYQIGNHLKFPQAVRHTENLTNIIEITFIHFTLIEFEDREDYEYHTKGKPRDIILKYQITDINLDFRKDKYQWNYGVPLHKFYFTESLIQ